MKKIIKFIISEVLGVTPSYLLSGAENVGERSRENRMYVFTKDSEIGELIETYQGLDRNSQRRLLGYMEALAERK